MIMSSASSFLVIDPVFRLLESFGIAPSLSVLIATVIAAAVALLFIVAVELLVKKTLLRIVTRLARKTSTSLDDYLVKRKVFSGLAMMSPPILLHILAPPVLKFYPDLIPFVRDAAVLYLAIVVVKVLFSMLDAIHDFLLEHPVGVKLPVKSFVQVFKTIVFGIAAIYILSRLLGKSPLVFFSGLGAFTAVLMLIFKDSILGLVAGVQLSSNDLVRPGDWIEMPKYGANGQVIDISLVTVSVQNNDKSIVTIPAYALISDGFKNWRGMTESDGRRIKRAICIDMTSVRFLDDELTAKMRKIRLLDRYLDERMQEIDAHNSKLGVEELVPVNGRQLTNLGTFRAYLTEYVHHLSKINPDLTVLVRYLQPEGMGLPVEIFCFSRDKAMVEFETIQADIIDHVLAVLPSFELRVFQLN